MDRSAEERFDDVFARHWRPLLSYAVRRVSQPADAADVVAETFVVASRHSDARRHRGRRRGALAAAFLAVATVAGVQLGGGDGADTVVTGTTAMPRLPGETLNLDMPLLVGEGLQLLGVVAPDGVPIMLDYSDDASSRAVDGESFVSSLRVRWRPLADHDDAVAGQSGGSAGQPVRSTSVLGSLATVVEQVAPAAAGSGTALTQGRYLSTVDFDRWTLTVDGTFWSMADFESAIGRLRAVDRASWLDALPASLLVPDAVPGAVEQFLSGVPLPAGLGVAELAAPRDAAGTAVIRARPEVASEVVQRLACGWLDAWVDATERSDQDAARPAVQAMAASDRWPALVEARDDRLAVLFAEMAAGVAAMRDGSPASLPSVDGRNITSPTKFRDAVRIRLACDGPPPGPG
jgi:hypothetical protein